MVIKHCPTCNRTSDKVRFIGEFCEVCVTGRLKKEVPDKATIERCKSCERIRTPTGYAAPDRNTLKEALQQQIGKRFSITVVRYDWKGADVRLSCDVEGNKAEFEKRIGLDVKRTMCIDCYRRTSGYYEAIFQLRGHRDAAERMMKKFVNFIETRGSFISRLDELDGGYDIYTSDKKVASAFFDYYGLKPKRSYTLYGLQRGRKVYRNTYMLRLTS